MIRFCTRAMLAVNSQLHQYRLLYFSYLSHLIYLCDYGSPMLTMWFKKTCEYGKNLHHIHLRFTSADKQADR